MHHLRLRLLLLGFTMRACVRARATIGKVEAGREGPVA